MKTNNNIAGINVKLPYLPLTYSRRWRSSSKYRERSLCNRYTPGVNDYYMSLRIKKKKKKGFDISCNLDKNHSAMI